jgi:hypothetical protein
MTYEELKEMGFSHQAILDKGIYPSGPQYSIRDCAEAWKLGKAYAEKGYDFTVEQLEQFKEMMKHYEMLTERRLPYIKGLDK